MAITTSVIQLERLSWLQRLPRRLLSRNDRPTSDAVVAVVIVVAAVSAATAAITIASAVVVIAVIKATAKPVGATVRPS